MERLKDIADLCASIPGKGALGHLCDIYAVQRDAAGCRPVEAGNQSEQGRLSAPGRSHDGHHLFGWNLKRDIVENRHRPPAGRQAHRDMLDRDHAVVLPRAQDSDSGIIL